MKNNMTAFRNHIFIMLEKLTDDETCTPENIEAAKAMAGLGKVLNESAKVELAFLKELNSGGDAPSTPFFELNKQKALNE
jgi:hypothetical protein